MLPFKFMSCGKRISSCRSIHFMSRRDARRHASKSLKYESLKTCTSKRWLFNDDAQMALRKLDFDVKALGKAAAQASGASRWTDMKLIAEGKFNRVLGISLDNGQDVVARLPFPNAGPSRLMTSSEVATMDFLRTRFSAPVPKVLAWNASSDNDVGVEYIIMEKCRGETLPFDKPSPFPVVASVANLMAKLATVSFSQYGSIYYKEDVDPLLQEMPLYADPELHDECSERFRIGPTVDRQFYRGGRAHLSIDRGPWTDALSYAKAVAACEAKWIETYSDTPVAKNQPGNLNTADDHLSVLDEWLHLAPAVLPEPKYCLPTLFHPGVDAEDVLCFHGTSKDTTYAIIGWQGASVQPLFQADKPNFISLDSCVVAMLEPEDIDFSSGDPADKYTINTTKLALLDELKRISNDLCSVSGLPRCDRFRKLVYLSSHSWSIGLPAFEAYLLQTASEYGNSIPVNDDYPVCPLSFTEEDIAKSIEELCPLQSASLEYDAIQDTMEKEGITIGRDGSVAAEDFEEARTIANAMFEIGDSLSRTGMFPDEGDVEETWPLREGQYVYNMESCM